MRRLLTTVAGAGIGAIGAELFLHFAAGSSLGVANVSLKQSVPNNVHDKLSRLTFPMYQNEDWR